MKSDLYTNEKASENSCFERQNSFSFQNHFLWSIVSGKDASWLMIKIEKKMSNKQNFLNIKIKYFCKYKHGKNGN